jgi:hypothetical protein
MRLTASVVTAMPPKGRDEGSKAALKPIERRELSNSGTPRRGVDCIDQR